MQLCKITRKYDLNHTTRVSLHNWQCGTFLNSPKAEVVVYEMPIMTKTDTRLSEEICKWHAWMCLGHLQTQKLHTSFLSLLSFQYDDSMALRHENHPTLVSPLFLTDQSPHWGWTGLVSSCFTMSSFSCSFCRDVMQGRRFPLLKHYSTGGRGRRATQVYTQST